MRNLFRSKFKITQEYGVNAAYYKQFGLSGHEGIDLIPTGSVWDVLALADGVVVKDENNAKSGAYGNYITLWHPSLNKATQYCHLKENYVENGQQVKMGDKLGLMGATGNTTGAHVHLNLFLTDSNGVRLNKDNGFLGGVDPLPFLNETAELVDTTALDACKAQVAEEVKKKNETYQELVETRNDLEGTKAQIVSYEDFIKQIGSLLKCEPDNNKILGEINKLIGLEDQVRQAQKAKEEAVEKARVLTLDVTEKEKMILDITSENESLHRQQDDLERKVEALEGVIQLIEKSQKLKPLVTIFGLTICIEKKEGDS